MTAGKPQDHRPRIGPPEPPARERRKGGRGRRSLRAALRCLVFTLCLLAFGAIAAILAGPDSLEAPGWLRDRIAARISRQMPDLSIGFDRLSLTIVDGWHPRLQLGSVHLSMPDGSLGLTVDSLSAAFSLTPLLEGRLEPRNIALSGARFRLNRRVDGSFGVISLGGGEKASDQPVPDRPANAGEIADAAQAGVARAGRDVTDAMTEFKQMLESPSLKHLTRVDAQNLSVEYDDLHSGKHWNADGGRLSLDRRGQQLSIRGDFAVLGGHSYATVVRTGYDTRLDEHHGDFRLSVENAPSTDLATIGPGLAWLGLLDAPLSGSLRVSIDQKGRVGPLYAMLRSGAGALRPSPDARPVPFSAASAYFTVDASEGSIDFTQLSVDSKMLRATAEGRVALTDVAKGPLAMVGQLRVTSLQADPGKLFAQPVTLDRADVDVKLQLDPFQLTLGGMDVYGPDLHMHAQGRFTVDKGGWDVSLQGRSGAMSKDALLSYWPEILADKSRDWVQNQVDQATVRNVEFALRAQEGKDPDIYLNFGFSDMRAVLLKGLPPVEGAAGEATLLRNRFAIHATRGHVQVPGQGSLDMAGSEFVVPDVKDKPSRGEVTLRVSGHIPDLLTVLDSGELKLMSKAGMATDMAQGQFTGTARIGFPLQDGPPADDELTASYSADLRDVDSSVLVPGRHLVASAMQLSGDRQALKVTGDAQVDGQPVDATFTTGLGKDAAPGHLVAGLTLNADFAKTFGLALPPDALSGAAPARLEMTLPKTGEKSFRLTSDLKGLGLRLDNIGWQMRKGESGALLVAGTIGPPLSVSELSMKAPGLSAHGTIQMTEDGALKQARFDQLATGGWIDGPVTLTGRGKDVTPAVAINGGWIDLSKLPKMGGAQQGGGPVRLNIDKLKMTPDLSLSNFRADLQTGTGITGRFTGKLNGQAPVSGQLAQVPKGTQIAIEADDAGAVLSAAGLLKGAKGGKLSLVLNPVEAGNDQIRDGKLQITDLSVVDAPAMADFLSAVSVVGLFQQMAGQGVHFARANADFRLTPDQLILRSGSASGASIGISLDGTYDIPDKRLNMQGVLSPLYLVNGLGSFMTRKGEGLLGVTFSLKGPAASPKIGVNPLSLLMPGFLREILRKPAPTTQQPAPGANAETGASAETGAGAETGAQ